MYAAPPARQPPLPVDRGEPSALFLDRDGRMVSVAILEMTGGSDAVGEPAATAARRGRRYRDRCLPALSNPVSRERKFSCLKKRD